MTQQNTNETTEREQALMSALTDANIYEWAEGYQFTYRGNPHKMTFARNRFIEAVRVIIGKAARAALPPTSGEAVQPTANIPQQAPCRNKLINEGAQMWPKSCQRCGIAKCPDGLVPNFPATKPAPAAPVADTGAVELVNCAVRAWSAWESSPIKSRDGLLFECMLNLHEAEKAFVAKSATPTSPAPTADSAADARTKITPALRRAAENTRMDLGLVGTNYPDIRKLLGFVEDCIAAMSTNTGEDEG